MKASAMLLSAVLMVAWQIDNDVYLSELAPRNEMHTRSSEVIIMEVVMMIK